MRGQVVSLDRGFPMVRLDDGRRLRCKHAVSLVKSADTRAVVGDVVEASCPADADVGQIVRILPRKRSLVRKDPSERSNGQVMAANFDTVMIAEPAVALNAHRLVRELVVACGTGADVVVLLTKCDLVESGKLDAVVARAKGIAAGAQVVPVAASDADSVERVRAMVPEGSVAVLLGRSGVGKSTLVNLLADADVQRTGAVRASDGKGRHTTVSRQMVRAAAGGYVVDMPGTRSMGMFQSAQGIAAAFPDITALSASCRFRDCTHHDEPGCAVRAAVAGGRLSEERLDGYLELVQENQEQAERAVVAQRKREHPGRPPRVGRKR